MATSLPTASRNSASAWATASLKACSQASPTGVNTTRLARASSGSASRCTKTPGGALVHQIAHGLLAHPGSAGQIGQARAVQRQVARDVHMRGTDLVTRGQIGQGQGHTLVARHQVQHALVKTPHRMAQQTAQMRLAPAVILQRRAAQGG